ncbi:MAG: chromate efflux transporter [Ramlibacter sp.]|nr:chromate efflux transporter [Ramlibacter sp.]
MSETKLERTTQAGAESVPARSNEGGQAQRLKEVAGTFLKLGAFGYGGPAIFGLFQAELQERKKWLSKERFLEGMALVHALPGAAAIQFCIFAGFQRGGLWAGATAGLGFMIPGFAIMLALTMLHQQFGNLPWMRHAFYGVAPVVVAVFIVATYRLGKNAIKDSLSIVTGLAAALLVFATPLGVAGTLLLAGCLGLYLRYSRKAGLIAAAAVLALVAVEYVIQSSIGSLKFGGAAGVQAPGLLEIGSFFLKVGAVTFGGGMTVLAFVQDQVVNQMHWITAEEFLDGLTLGQFTPGPILMLAAFIGFKLAGLSGAAVAATAIFLPSFILMLSILPALERFRQASWVRAAMESISPAVVGVIAVSFVQLVPHAAPDLFTASVLLLTTAAMLRFKLPVVPLLLAGVVVGVVAKAALG